MQELLTVVQKVELREALPQSVILLELAAVTPFTSIHCEKVFSRMKRVVSSGRATKLQKRKEMLVALQVEHKILRGLQNKHILKPV